MPRMRITLEDVLEIDRAIEMVEKEDSTDPMDIELVEDYKDQLQKLQDSKQEESDTDDSDVTDDSTDNDSDDSEIESEDTSEETTDDSDDADDDSEETSDDDETEEESDDDESETEDKDKDDDSKETDKPDTKEVEEKQEEADKALESLTYALECYEQLTVIKERGGIKRQSALSPLSKAMEQLHLTSSKLSISTESLPSFESLQVTDFVQANKQIGVALEGLTDYIKAAYEKIIAIIKWIYNWLKDYFFYDPVKDQKTDAIWRGRREKLKDMQKRALSYQNYIRDASLAIGNKQYRDRANFIVVGNKDVSGKDALNGISKTVDFVSQYWANTASYVKSNVLLKMKEVLDFDKTSEFATPNSGYLNVSFASYQPVPLVKETNYRSVNQKELPPGFGIYVGKTNLCGDKRLMLIMPDKPLADPAIGTRFGSAYNGFMSSDENAKGDRKAIFYTEDISLLQNFTEIVQRAYADKRKLSVFITELIRTLESTTNKMTRSLETMNNQTIPASVRSAHLRRLRFNISVLNNMFDKPLVSSVYFFDRLFSAVDHFVDKNLTIVENVVKDLEKKKEELGLNL